MFYYRANLTLLTIPLLMGMEMVLTSLAIMKLETRITFAHNFLSFSEYWFRVDS